MSIPIASASSTTTGTASSTASSTAASTAASTGDTVKKQNFDAFDVTPLPATERSSDSIKGRGSGLEMGNGNEGSDISGANLNANGDSDGGGSYYLKKYKQASAFLNPGVCTLQWNIVLTHHSALFFCFSSLVSPFHCSVYRSLLAKY